MSDNILAEMRQSAINDFLRQPPSEERVDRERQAREVAREHIPIHYDVMAEVITAPYNGVSNYLLHCTADSGLLPRDPDVMQCAEAALFDFLMEEMLEAWEQDQKVINWEHRLIFTKEQDMLNAEQRVNDVLGEDRILESSIEYDPDERPTYEFTFATHLRIAEQDFLELIQHTHVASSSVNNPYNG